MIMIKKFFTYLKNILFKKYKEDKEIDDWLEEVFK